MTAGLILITGATSFVGYPVLIEALCKGYNVRVAVRSEAKFINLKEAKQSQAFGQKLTHVVIPEHDKEGAFDEAIKDVDYIIHIASPPPSPADDQEETVIKPAINATLGILKSALKVPSIKRIVITSSLGAVLPDQPTERFTVDTLPSEPAGPYRDPFTAYLASKKLTYLRTRDFVHTHSPHYTLINILPSFVIGANALAKSAVKQAGSSNRHIFMPLLGQHNPVPMPTTFCHPSEVAHVHVAALSIPVEEKLVNFGVSNPLPAQYEWNDSISIVKKHFPTEVDNGLFPLGGSVTSVALPFDASHTDKRFGLKKESFEEVVVDAVGHYIELARLHNIGRRTDPERG